MAKQNNKPDISIIIPCYDTESYIDACLDSVLCQKNIRNCEVICIDDNSSDSTYKKLQKTANKYPRIVKVIKNNQNLGVSSTRNVGISKATGNGIMFLDSDDAIGCKPESKIIDTHYLENFQETLSYNPFASMAVGNIVVTAQKNGDIIFNHRFNNLFKYSEKKGIDFNTALDFLDERISSCAVLFRNKLIQDFNIRFMPQLMYFEDANFVTRYAIASINEYKKILTKVPDYSFYMYRRRANSAMTKLSQHSEKYMRRFERTQNKMVYYSMLLLQCNELSGANSHIYNIVAHRFTNTIKQIKKYMQDSDKMSYENLLKLIPKKCTGCIKNRCSDCENNNDLMNMAEFCKNSLLYGKRVK